LIQRARSPDGSRDGRIGRDARAKIYYYSHPNVIWSVGAGLNVWTLEKDARCAAVWMRAVGNGRRARARHGMCRVAASRLTDKIGLLDERFFYYYDDADLSLRVAKQDSGRCSCRSQNMAQGSAG